MGTRPHLTFHPRPCFTNGECSITRLRSQQCWKALRILAESGGWTDRDALAVELWPELEAKRARHNLRQCLLYIRQSIPDSKAWLVGDAERLRIDSSLIDINLEVVEEEAVEAEPLVMPRLAAIFARMDEEARRAAVAAMTPAWITSGCHAEGLDEIDKLRRAEPNRPNAELILCEAELQNAAYHAAEAVQALEEFQQLKGPVPLDLQARFLVSRSHTTARLYQYDDSIRYALLAYRTARTLQDRALAIRALQLAATCLVEVGNFEDARRAIARGLSITENDPQNPGRPFLYLILTRLELVANDHAAARAASEKGIESSKTTRSQPGVNGIVAARIGRLRESLGDPSGAAALYRYSHELMAETECVQEKAEIHTYLGDAYRAGGEMEKSLESHKKAVVLRRTLRTPDALGTSLRGMGMAAQRLGDHHLAIKCLSESAMLFEGCGRGIGTASALIPLSRSYAAVNRIAEAVPMFGNSLELLDRELVGPRRLQLPLDLSKVDEMKVELNVLASRRSSPRNRAARA